MAVITRRRWLGAVLVWSACSHRRDAGRLLLARTVAGVWHLEELHEERRPGSRRVLHARYGGPGVLRVDLYDVSSPAVALDMAQRRRPEADMVFFSQDHYFAVIRWERAEREALKSFVRALEKALAPAP